MQPFFSDHAPSPVPSLAGAFVIIAALAVALAAVL
jgi:hypothetical protein